MIDRQELYKALCIIVQNKEGLHTTKSALISGGSVGTCALISCALLGPIGLAVGATVGSIGSYFYMKDSFKSVFEVIEKDLSEEERSQLIQHMGTFLDKLRITDITVLLSLVNGNSRMVDLVYKEICSWLKTAVVPNEMRPLADWVI